MNKKFKEYHDKYGNVPNDFVERFQFILQELKPDKKDWDKVKKGIKKLQSAKWDNVNFIFYFIPQATPRARFSNRTRVFYVKNAFDYNTLFKQFIENTNDLYKMITTPCRFYCDLYFEMPTQMNKVEKILSELRLIGAPSKPDWDNCGKTYSDMVQKHLILDDCTITGATVNKFYSFKPRIEIRIEYLEQYDCKYNKKKIEKWKAYKECKRPIEEKDAII